MTHTRLTRRQLLLTTAGVTTVGLAGCTGAPGSGSQSISNDDQPGHDDEPHGHEEVNGPTDTAEVAVNTARFEDSTEFHFDPHVTWVTVGGTVTWRLESGTHTATAYHPDNGQPQLVPDGTEAWDSGTMSEVGETYEYTFDTEGVYHYLCKPHEQFGMLATVIVGEPHLDDQPALQLPDEKSDEVIGKLEELDGMVREALGDDHEEEEPHEEEGTHAEEDAHEEEGTHEEEDTHAEDDHTDDGH